jgi:hypothetical protein
MKVLPMLEISLVNMPPFQGFSRTAYLFCPEFVHFRVTPPNLTQHEVHLAEQVKVFWKRLR